MFKPDSQSVTPPPLPPARPRVLSPLAITAICVGADVVVLLIGALVVAGVFHAQAQNRRVQTVRAEAAPVLVAEAAPAVPEETRAARPAGARPAAGTAGVTYRNHKLKTDEGEPWSLHILKVDRSRQDLGFYSAHARDRVLAVSSIRDQAAAVPPEIGTAFAGVNGDFYVRDQPTYAGDPRGLQIMNGELISAPDTVCVWFDTNGNPRLDEVKDQFEITWANGKKTPFGLNEQVRGSTAVVFTPTFGTSTRTGSGKELILEKDGDGPWLPLRASQTYRARVREISPASNTRIAPGTMVLSLGSQLAGEFADLKPGATLQIATTTAPDLTGVTAAIAGGPALIKDGKAFNLHRPPPGAPGGYAEASKYARHPRAAIGWSPTHFYFIVVDGRQPAISVGMKLAELAEYFASLGCTDAMNLDGGKSAQLWFNSDGREGRIMNSPVNGEDTVANALLLIRKPVAN